MTKYIVVNRHGTELPFVFSDLCQHYDIARAVGGEVVGAGFCEIVDDQYVCYGESISCRVFSRKKQDAAVLNRMLVGGI
jgi:hypothetical protein